MKRKASLDTNDQKDGSRPYDAVNRNCENLMNAGEILLPACPG